MPLNRLLCGTALGLGVMLVPASAMAQQSYDYDEGGGVYWNNYEYRPTVWYNPGTTYAVTPAAYSAGQFSYGPYSFSYGYAGAPAYTYTRPYYYTYSYGRPYYYTYGYGQPYYSYRYSGPVYYREYTTPYGYASYPYTYSTPYRFYYYGDIDDLDDLEDWLEDRFDD